MGGFPSCPNAHCKSHSAQLPWDNGNTLRIFMLKFYIQVSKDLYFLNSWIDLVDAWTNVRYWSKVEQIMRSALFGEVGKNLKRLPLQIKNKRTKISLVLRLYNRSQILNFRVEIKAVLFQNVGLNGRMDLVEICTGGKSCSKGIFQSNPAKQPHTLPIRFDPKAVREKKKNHRSCFIRPF